MKASVRDALIIGAVGIAVAVNVFAFPLDLVRIDYGITTGVDARIGRTGQSATLKDGLDLGDPPIWTFLEDKTYTFRQIQFGAGEKDESYVEYAPQSKPSFASALAEDSNLEVGVFHNLVGTPYLLSAASRFQLRIKNTSQDVPLTGVEFEFHIPQSTLVVRDATERYRNIGARVGAMIDYTLLTPAGPFGGTFDETTGSLLDYFYFIDDELKVTRTANTTIEEQCPILGSNSVCRDVLAPYSGTVVLPEIAPFGELTLYYDMYATVNGLGETVAEAFIGDPMDLNGAQAFRLILPDGDDGGASVPEPATGALLGLLSVFALRRLMAANAFAG